MRVMINEELPEGFPSLIEPRISGGAEALPADLRETDWNRELVGTVYLPIIKELVEAIVSASAGDGATPNEFLSCHVELFGKWSLLPPVLRTFLVTVRLTQAKSELEPAT